MKGRILKLLEEGDKRLSDIYPELGLSPATVSQHLKELKGMHLIREVENSHFKNMKYYTLENGPNKNAVKKMPYEIKPQVLRISISAIVIMAVIAASIMAFESQSAASAQSVYLPILMTDPPHVPIGTQSLNITYSLIKIQVTKDASSTWINVNATGTIDLLSLVNTSSLITKAKIPSNATVDRIGFIISNASIKIGNTTYPVDMPINDIIANISTPVLFNGTTGALVDISPTIITLYTDNSTIFEMVPSIKAIMVGSGTINQQWDISGKQMIGKLNKLNDSILEDLGELNSSISIANANITTSNNDTRISMAVKDISNRSVELNHMLIFGNEALYVNINSIMNYPMPINPTTSLSLPPIPIQSRQVIARSIGPQEPNSGIITQRNSVYGRANASRYKFEYNLNGSAPENWLIAYNWSSGKLNSSLIGYNASQTSVSGSQNSEWARIGSIFVPKDIGNSTYAYAKIRLGMDAAYFIGTFKQRIGMINLVINDNGTITSQTQYPIPEPITAPGFILNPGQTAVLNFNGTVALGPDFISAHFINGSSYKIVVVGSEGSTANYTVSAS